MTISVLMSVYKAEKAQYLDRALRSVWNDQILKPSQIVLVEDGPLGDELQRVIDEWKERLNNTLVVIKNSSNVGLTKSLNKGLCYCSSDLIARMDSDDISTYNRFYDQVDYLEKHPNITIVGGQIDEFSVEGSIIGHRIFPLTHEQVCGYIVKASPFAHPAVMMRRQLFDVVKYNECYRTSQDIALWFDAIGNGFCMGNVDSVVLNFRRSDDVYQRRSRSKAYNEFRIYMRGIYKIKGVFTLAYIYPCLRFLFRMLPRSIVKAIYGGKTRQRLLNR